MEWIATYRGTVTAGPNFSYALAGCALGRGGALDLSSLRLALNGAEPVDPDAVEAFVAAGARHGLSASAMFPAFGMAEATLAVTFPPTGRGMRTDCIDRVTLESERYAAPVSSDHVGARRLARLGAAVPGLEVRIVDPSTGLEMLEREAGELEVRGTSITTGYYRQAEATAAVFHDGWLRTGDLAYMADGDLVVCGRLKDVIILGGRNVFPEDIERAVAQVHGVRVGNVVAFGITGRRGKEAVIVVAEAKVDLTGSGDETVADAVARRVRETVGIPPEAVVLVAPGTLPKTSSGKLQRSLCRTLYVNGELS